jgi:hypothetical protein
MPLAPQTGWWLDPALPLPEPPLVLELAALASWRAGFDCTGCVALTGTVDAAGDELSGGVVVPLVACFRAPTRLWCCASDRCCPTTRSRDVPARSLLALMLDAKKVVAGDPELL